MFSLVRFLNLAKRAVTYAGTIALVAEGWQRLEAWYTQAFASPDADETTQLQQAAQSLTAAITLCNIGNFSLALRLYKAGVISPDTFIRAALITAASEGNALSNLSEATAALFQTQFGRTDIPAVYADPAIGKTITALMARELERRSLSNIF